MNIFTSPNDYNQAAFLSSETMEGLWERLSFMTIKPECIVDLGCGTGELSAQIQNYYPGVKIISLDLSEEMLAFAQIHYPSANYLQARAKYLPIANNTVDLIFANLLFPWIMDIKTVLQECRRILKPNGLFFCTALGPDSLKEIRAQIQAYQVVNLIDMHDLGDLFLAAGFSDPVLDVSYCSAIYKEQTKLLHELKSSGILGPDTPTDTPLDTQEISFEIIYGHAFAPLSQKKSKSTETKVSLNELRQSLRK